MMKISGSYAIKAPRAKVWERLIDPESLARSIPGCKQLEQTKPNHYKARLEVNIASIKGGYDGEVRLTELSPPSHFRMSLEGQGKRGHLKGTGELNLEENEETTTINYAGDLQVGGLIASVGQRLVLAAAKKFALQFFNNFTKII